MRNNFLNYFTDRIELFFNMRKTTTPGKKLRLLVGPFSDPRKYETDAEDFIDKMLKLVKISNNSRILEVGCGSGRLIFELHSRYPQSHLYGFDIIHSLIEWADMCSERLNGKFNFEYLNVYNKLYNPKGNESGSKIRFNYPDNYFNLIIVQSVFTHMKYDDILNYLNEISRVLSPKGKAVITFFLINDKSKLAIAKHLSDFNFRKKMKHEYLNDEKYPEAAIAYDEDIVIEMLDKTRLKSLQDGVRYGKWFGDNGFVYQDLLLVGKNL